MWESPKPCVNFIRSLLEEVQSKGGSSFLYCVLWSLFMPSFHAIKCFNIWWHVTILNHLCPALNQMQAQFDTRHEVRLALCSTFAPPTYSIVSGWNSAWLEDFSPGTPVFLPVQKSTPSQKHLAWVLCLGITCMTVWRQPEAPFICIRPISSELRSSQFSPRGCK